MIDLEGFQCRTCGEWHKGVPLDWAYDAPSYWSTSLASDPGCFLNSDFCVIKEKDYFVRCVIELPIIGSVERFCWGVWTSLSKSNFDRIVERWENPQPDEPSYFGWVSNSIDVYPETLNLKVSLHNRDARQRPSALLEPTDHPLAIEQRNSITVDRVREIAERAMHR